MSVRALHLALAAMLASLAVAAPVTGTSGGTVSPPAAPVVGPAGGTTPLAPPGFTAPAAIPAPGCSLPGGAGVLALLVPPRPGGGSSGTAPADPGVGTTRTAVVDRFEGDRAVLLVEARGEVVGRRLVRRAALPRAARHQDAVVTVSVVADSVVAIAYRPVETARRERAAERRFERLSEPAGRRAAVVRC